MLWDWIDDSDQKPPISGWNDVLNNFDYTVEYNGQYTIFSLAEEV